MPSIRPELHTDDSAARPKNRPRELRVGLVLYGGVSLAIYENGVAHAFFDLVRGNGPMELLLDLLDADAVVDVIAGTSAGGINGLMLAAALESGADFSIAADLWREHGDLGRLLRDFSEAEHAQSLLDGDGYYHARLTEAFEELCRPPDPSYVSPSEIDVFITGTDLHGTVKQYWDSLGNPIEDKEHRTVFRLKHRPGRRALGMSEPKSRTDSREQAALLASVARITSTFPGAFPPFNVNNVSGPFQSRVSEALRQIASPWDDRDRTLVDGGVLDNKPFGPALEAIFYRMPTRLVDRRLFYLEPDPVEYGEREFETPSPLAVVWSSLSSIPAHESIGGDLDLLMRHNARVQWMREIKQGLWSGSGGSPPPGPADRQLYRHVRLQGMAAALVMHSGQAPCAMDLVLDPERRSLYDELVRELEEKLSRSNDAAGVSPTADDPLDAYDIHFHLRRTFFVLYRLHDALKEGSESEHAPEIRRLMSRVGDLIKVLKIIRDMMLVLRESLLANRVPGGVGRAATGIRLAFGRFLDASAPQWSALIGARHESANSWRYEELTFEPVALSSLAEAARKAAENPREGDFHSTTILIALRQTLDHLLDEQGWNVQLQEFEYIDTRYYPLEFSSGMHELDEIQFVRISPVDARLGMAGEKRGMHKVTGEGLGHFAAFFRRDWRANDILWGRLDGIAQIVASVVDDEAIDRAQARRSLLDESFSSRELARRFPACSDSTVQGLARTWRALASGDGAANANENFRSSLARALQEEVFLSADHKVYADTHYQEIVWGREKDSKACTSFESADERIAEDGERLARRDMPKSPEERWLEFKKRNIGMQQVFGKNGRVPHHVMGEYATLAYLMLWGMAGRSTGRLGQLLGRRARGLFRTPVALAYRMFRMIREQYHFAAIIMAVVPAVLLALIVMEWNGEGKALQIIAYSLALLAFAIVAMVGTPQRSKRRTYGVLFIGLVLSLLILGSVHWGWLDWLGRLF